MDFLDQIKDDVSMITTGEFSSSVTFIATNGVTGTIQAIHNKIGRKVDSESGIVVNAKNASVVFSESVMKAMWPLYPVRNASTGEVAMIGHKISVKDNTGVIKNYVVKENICDENSGVGLITLLLGDYGSD